MKSKKSACRGLLSMLVGTFFVLNYPMADAAGYSDLWGEQGEAWSPQSRLPDFSYAGYHSGEDPLPEVEVVANVKDFGAKGDGTTDDTDAFKRAIAETQAGAILIPAGRYVLSDLLWIYKSNLVLRGEGIDQTELHFVTELEDVRPSPGATTSGRPTSNYSWSGGFLWVAGNTKMKEISAIVSEAARGEQVLTLDQASGLEVGQRVVVEMQDHAERTLLDALYSGDAGGTDMITKPVVVRMVSRVASIEGTRIVLERPLRWDLRQDWKPTLKTFEPSVSEVGIEELAITFPVKPYLGHFTERGMNAIAISNASDCWVRNVKVSNCDSGVSLGGTFCEIDGLILDGEREAFQGDTGHHGVNMGQDCLLQNFDFQVKFIHDITLSYYQAGNVIKNGQGVNLSFDHHKKAPHDNLFCNIDVGEGSQVWRCGGGQQLGKHCGARGTFWGIRSQQDLIWPREAFGPDSMNFVGVQTSAASIKERDGKWFEAIPPEELQPIDLHAAQLARRLAKE